MHAWLVMLVSVSIFAGFKRILPWAVMVPGAGMLLSCRVIRDGSIEVPSTSSALLSFLKPTKSSHFP